LTAGYQKIFAPDPALGFLAHARLLIDASVSGQLPAGVASAAAATRMAVNDKLDAGVAAFFIICVIVVLLASMREWWMILSGRKVRVTTEISFETAASVAVAQ
ncbi:MAG TPA: carbon starvation protein A, partial [Gemmatimonadaceae bacterium]